MNVALYGADGHRWAMTERGRAGLGRSRDAIEIGPSSLRREGDGLVATLDEMTVPWPSRLRGSLRIRPEAYLAESFALDDRGLHQWRPFAPCARVEVELERPALRWSGRGYLDSNRGDAPLESAFVRWDWSRSLLDGGATGVLYDVERRDGGAHGLALRFSPDGRVEAVTPPERAPLPSTLWRVDRATRSERPSQARVIETLEDTPFYARSWIETHLEGEPTISVHESLSLDRFGRRWVQVLLPFRMPRRRR